MYNEIMKLYHGSDKIIEKPTYGAGRSDCDYGSGFYLCKDFDVASLWASQNKDGGYVNEYNVELSKLKILYLNHNTKEDILQWITLLTFFRIDEETRLSALEEIKLLQSRYMIDLSKFDLIVGYRADDSYFDYTRFFLTNQLPLELLKEAMELGKLGLQYALISKKAFKHIKYISSTRVQHNNAYDEITKTANAEFEDIMRKKKVDQTYLRDILRENN